MTPTVANIDNDVAIAEARLQLAAKTAEHCSRLRASRNEAPAGMISRCNRTTAEQQAEPH